MFGPQMISLVKLINANAAKFMTLPIGPVGFHVELAKGIFTFFRGSAVVRHRLLLQWGSENRPFENRKHAKTGHFYVRFSNGKNKMADLA